MSIKLSVSVDRDEWELLTNEFGDDGASSIVQILMAYYIANELHLERRVEWVSTKRDGVR